MLFMCTQFQLRNFYTITSLYFACLPPLSEPGRFLWVRQLHREHRWQCADELPVQPCDGDDPRWLHDVRRCRISHDDLALPSGH